MAWCYRPARLAVLAIVVACSRAPGGADAACKAAGQSCRTSGDVCQVGYFCRDWSGNGLGECQTNLQQGGYCDGGGNCNAGFYCFNRNLPHSKLVQALSLVHCCFHLAADTTEPPARILHCVQPPPCGGLGHPRASRQELYAIANTSN